MGTNTSIHNWWPDLHACSLSSSWTVIEPNNNSESSEEGNNMSISTSNYTNASNNSGLTAESSYGLESASAKEFIGETAASDNHIWSQILKSVGSSQGLHNTQDDVGENLPSGLMFDPTYDYSKKLDNINLEFLSSTSFNNFEKQLDVVKDDSSFGSLRNSKSSNLGRNWPISCHGAQVNYKIDFHSTEDGSSPNLCRGRKQSFGSISCFGHDVKMDAEHRESTDYIGSNNFGYSHGLQNAHGTSSKGLANYISSGSYPNRPSLLHTKLSKDIPKTPDLSGCRKQAFQTLPFPSPKLICNTLIRNNRSTQGVLLNTGRKKRKSEENSESVLKKPKQEASIGSSPKVPKVKLTDKITVLQQIVSPFGKTDTASVLWETIGYIRFLQEQIKLHSSPYLKGTNGRKDLWQGLERKERGEGKFDLKSRGLCLVPVSCTPQIYRENNIGSHYLTPAAYRGCLNL